MTFSRSVQAVFLIGLIIFSERLFPFVVFSKKKPGRLFYIFERYIPPVVMLGLLIYSIRGTRFSSIILWLPQIAALLFTISTYLWKKNSLVSIFGGTAVYMILLRVL